MIVNLFIDVIAAVLLPIFSLLPTGSVGAWAETAVDHFLYGDGLFTGSLRLGNIYLPMGEFFAALSAVMALVIPGVIGYKLANWIYRHIPQLWGFGPGSG